MPSALYRLLMLRARAKVRRMFRVQGNPKRLVLLIVCLAAMLLWVGMTVMSTFYSPRQPNDAVRDLGPLLLGAFVIISLLTTSGEAAIAFQPAEVDILFPGPFTRRQLLLYKLMSGMIGSLFGALVFSIVFARHLGHWLPTFAGCLLAIWFMQFLATGVALLKQIGGELAYTRARRLGLLAVVVALVVLVTPAVNSPDIKDFKDAQEVLLRINTSTAGTVLLAPFRVFFSLAGAKTLGGALAPLAVGLAMNLALVLLIIRLDTNFLEASIRSSERMADRLKRARSGNIFAPRAGDAPVRSRHAQIRYFIGGAGPVAWRQSTSILRSGKRWVVQAIIILAVAAVLLLNLSRIEAEGVPVGLSMGVLGYVTIILAGVVRLDFRTDLDHLETLKSLPLDPRGIALGELVVPALVLTAVQAVYIAGAAIVLRWPVNVVVATAAALPVVNLVLLALENLLFLLFPVRLTNRGAGDFSLMGRQMLLFLGKFIVYAIIGGIGAGVFVLTKLITGLWTAGAAGAWLVMALAAVLMVQAVAKAFAKFDVSADMPD